MIVHDKITIVHHKKSIFHASNGKNTSPSIFHGGNTNRSTTLVHHSLNNINHNNLGNCHYE